MSKTIPSPEALAVTSIPKWDNGDASSLRNYLERNPRFLTYLAARTPAIETTSLEVAALTGATHAGYEALFKALSSMASDNHVDQKSPFIGPDEEGGQ